MACILRLNCITWATAQMVHWKHALTLHALVQDTACHWACPLLMKQLCLLQVLSR